MDHCIFYQLILETNKLLYNTSHRHIREYAFIVCIQACLNAIDNIL